jgi:hypothetical protein
LFKSLLIVAAGFIKWQTTEAVRIAEKMPTEEKAVLLHTMAQNKGEPSTGEVTRTGGIRNDEWIETSYIIF